ncbi:MAG: hypothetical protein M0R46_05815 [Candidatus Muirbacterium halophilum]|nr:hypothetical protein [Candidatus Muirbacterium halophilum]MCK9475413.1 hypothetical protein [Candidatus Muirbacterium halophilum]
MDICKKCGNRLEEYFEWKFAYGHKKKKIIHCEKCGFKKDFGLVEL